VPQTGSERVKRRSKQSNRGAAMSLVSFVHWVWVAVAATAVTLATAAQTHQANENEALRKTVNAIASVPPGRGLPQFCTRIIDINLKRSTCADRGSLSEPVIFAMPYDNGAYIIKLRYYLKTDSPSNFVLNRVNSATKQETFLAQWDESVALSETYGKKVSVSPDGKRIALIRNAPPMKDTKFKRKQGTLDIFDIDSKTWQPTAIEALDGHPVQWLDDQRIVFSRAVKRELLPAELTIPANETDRYGADYERASIIPVIFIRDLTMGTERAIHIGEVALALPQHNQIIIQDGEQRLRIATLGGDLSASQSTFASVPLTAPPGITHRGVIGFAGPTQLLYWAQPLPGREIGYTKSNSPLVGPKQLLSLRIADIRTGDFVTVIERIDPRSHPAVYVKRQ
jgi:hypothetical protein